MEDFFGLVDGLRRYNDERRKGFEFPTEDIELLNYLKEFRTVHVDVGRRSGNSSYIKARATCSDVIVCFNFIASKNFVSDSKLGTLSVCVSGFLPDSWENDIPRFDVIYVDEPAMCDMEWVYRTFGKDTGQQFVLMGR